MFTSNAHQWILAPISVYIQRQQSPLEFASRESNILNIEKSVNKHTTYPNFRFCQIN